MSDCERRLTSETSSVRQARLAVTEVLDGRVEPDLLDRVLLCTSEVVTNAIDHGAPPIDLKVIRWPEAVRVEVSDGSPLRPRVQDPEPTAIRGRGLLIVDQMSDRWGVDEEAHGKTVWFEFRT